MCSRLPPRSARPCSRTATSGPSSSRNRPCRSAPDGASSVGGKFLHAGPGFGGSCFPKDCQALVRTAEEMKAPLAIVDTVLRVNDARKRSMARRVVEACGGSVEGLTLAALGLTFKPNTDDMRDH